MNSVKFLHIADIHLGKRQYNVSQRYQDYFTAFRSILNKAIEQEVNFILISGDLIDSDEGVNPSMLGEIIAILNTFKDESIEQLKREIPLICIEGNHENPLFSDLTWLKLLADLELIVLLTGVYDRKKNEIYFEEYSSLNHSGGKITVNDCNIYGLNYFGSATGDLLPLIKNAIPKRENDFNILMMHFGIADYDEKKTGLTFSPVLEEMHQSVDYLALGHFHMQYNIPESHPWIFNPGSLEVNEVSENFQERGAFLIEVLEQKKIQIQRLLCVEGNSTDPFSIPNRRFMVIKDIDISGINNFSDAQKYIVEKLTKYGVPLKANQKLHDHNLDKPILYFSVKGIISYSQLDLDFSSLRTKIYEKFDILGLKMSNKLISSMDQEIVLDDDLSIEEIEKEIFIGTLALEKKFEPFKVSVFENFEYLKNHLTGKKSHKKVKSKLESWVSSNKDFFSQLLSEISSKEALTDNIRETKRFRRKKDEESLQERKKEGEEFGLSELDYGDLLEDGDIGDLIDDEDLDI
ncbi:MAG: DNA repair exonuclease [Promethearchaeota archaeon]|nr:MAG: DNA repair exonuclease [Candidatus Lokiarchaeota archaeon]